MAQPHDASSSLQSVRLHWRLTYVFGTCRDKLKLNAAIDHCQPCLYVRISFKRVDQAKKAQDVQVLANVAPLPILCRDHIFAESCYSMSIFRVKSACYFGDYSLFMLQVANTGFRPRRIICCLCRVMPGGEAEHSQRSPMGFRVVISYKIDSVPYLWSLAGIAEGTIA